MFSHRSCVRAFTAYHLLVLRRSKRIPLYVADRNPLVRVAAAHRYITGRRPFTQVLLHQLHLDSHIYSALLSVHIFGRTWPLETSGDLEWLSALAASPLLWTNSSPAADAAAARPGVLWPCTKSSSFSPSHFHGLLASISCPGYRRF